MPTMKLMLFDGNSILNRAFYGIMGPNLLTTSDGLYTNAVFGFINILNKYLEEDHPEYLCVAFDLRAPTIRHLEFAEYKANRKGMPSELAVQMPVIKEVLDAMNIKRVESEGYEADDIIGTLAFKAEEYGLEVVIVTGDRDALQLASSKTRIKIIRTKAGKNETVEYTEKQIQETFGITPTEFIDVKGLMGDASDNIPGIPGVGEKTALELIKTFSCIENLYDNIDKITKKSLKEKLIENKSLAFLSRKLATINKTMPNEWDIRDLKRREIDRTRLYDVFKKLEFKSLIKKYKLGEASNELMAFTDIQVTLIESLSQLNNLKNDIKREREVSLYYLLDKNSENLSGISVCLKSMLNDFDAKFYIKLHDCIKEDEFVNEFKEIFESHEIKKYGHDLKSLITYLKSRGVDFNGLGFDTFIAAYILNPSMEAYSVSDLSKIYLSMQIESIELIQGKGKKHLDFSEIPQDLLSSLSCRYSSLIFKLVKIFDEKIKENEQTKLYYDVELPLIEVLASMEYYGIMVDRQALVDFSLELDEKIRYIEHEIHSIACETFNINSPKQLGQILFEKLNLPIVKKNKTGYSTDVEVLEKLLTKHEIISNILEYRQLIKLKTTYVEGLLNVINPKTKRIHSSFNQTVTVTGRISSTEPNLQNIPIKLEMGRKIRKVFIPINSDYCLVDADYSQIELRVLAHITKDQNMINAFLNDEDIHTTTASNVFNVPKENITTLLRSRAKAVNFGIVYGIGDFSLAKDLNITKKEARRYIDEYLDKYPNVHKYMKDIVEYGKNNGYVKTLFNRKREIPELRSSNFNIRQFGERIAMNTPIQGTAADIIKIAMVNVYNELKTKNLKSRLILQVHDELIIETYNNEVEIVKALLKNCMENAVKLEVPLKVDVKSGNSWYETK